MSVYFEGFKINQYQTNTTPWKIPEVTPVWDNILGELPMHIPEESMLICDSILEQLYLYLWN